MRIAIVDDLEQDIKYLANGIQNWFHFHEQGEEAVCDRFGSGEDLLDNISVQRPYDLIFLDICMKKMDGIQTAGQLRRFGYNSLIVFVTTQQEYALEAYPVHPFDFLVKPFTQERLNRLLQDVMAMHFHNNEEITVRVAHGEITLPLGQIISAVASGHGTEYLMSDGRRIQTLRTFSETEKMLKEHEEFLTINRALCINMDQISQIREEQVVMNGHVSYPLKHRGRAQLIREMTQYQIKNRMRGI